MGYVAWSVVFGEQPTAAKWNILGENDESFNDGTGIADNAILQRHLAANIVDFDELNTDVSWWQEIGRTTLGSAGDTITVSSLPGRKYLKIFCMLLQAGAIDSALKFNNDSGANYAWNISTDGGANSKTASSTFVPGQTSGTANQLICFEVTNLAAQAKQVIGNVMNDGAVGAGTAPVRREVVAKWHNTSAQISRIDVINAAGGDYAIGSELVVLGHD